MLRLLFLGFLFKDGRRALDLLVQMIGSRIDILMPLKGRSNLPTPLVIGEDDWRERMVRRYFTKCLKEINNVQFQEKRASITCFLRIIDLSL